VVRLVLPCLALVGATVAWWRRRGGGGPGRPDAADRDGGLTDHERPGEPVRPRHLIAPTGTVKVIPPATRPARVVVALRRDGRPVTLDATVTARPAGGEPGGAAVTFQPAGGRYRAELPPGRHRIEVQPADPGLVGLERTVELIGAPADIVLDVVTAGAPRLRRATGQVVVRPRLEDVVLAIEPPLDGDESVRLRQALSAVEQFEPVPAPAPRPPSPGPGPHPTPPAPAVPTGAEFRLIRRAERSRLAAAIDEDLGQLLRAAQQVVADPTRLRAGFVVEAADGPSDRGPHPILTDRYVVQLAGRRGTDVADGARAEADEHDERTEQVERVERTHADDPEERAVLDEVCRRLDAEVLSPLWLAGWYLLRVRHRRWEATESTIGELMRVGLLISGEAELLSPVLDGGVTLADYTAPAAQRSTHLDHMDLVGAWAQTLGNPTVRVATFDRGVAGSSPYLEPSTLVAVPSSAAVQADPGVEHGMEVYSLVSGTGKDGCWGVAPNCTHVVGKLSAYFDTTYWSRLRDVVVVGGASVVSLSHEGPWGAALSLGVETLHELTDLGVLFVAAAGNAGRRVHPFVPTTRLDCGRSTDAALWVDNTLAAHPRVITVGLTELQSGTERSWLADLPDVGGSNYGDTVDLCVYADLITTAQSSGPIAATGTSMAAPVVAAAAALVRSVNPALGPVQVRTILCRTADVIAARPTCFAVPGGIELGDYQRGGVTQRPWDPAVDVGQHHLRFGWGRLNIGRAVRFAASYPNLPVPW
jgi:subtilisin family serine protease